MAAPLPTPIGGYSWTLKVPILMYHYISQPPADADVYRVDLSVTPDNFRQQLAWLRDNGYTAIDYYDLSLAIVGHIELPEKPVPVSYTHLHLVVIVDVEVARPLRPALRRAVAQRCPCLLYTSRCV